MAEGNEAMGGSQKRTLAVIAGLAVWVLVSLCCIGVLVLPTVKVAWDSLMHVQLISPGVSEFIGLENYQHLFQYPVFSRALGNTLSLAAARVAVVVLVPLLLAIVINEFGRWVRIPVRLMFTVPVALFAPTLVTFVYRLVYHPAVGLMNERALADPDLAWAAVVGVDRWTTFGLAWSIGLIFCLSALRGSGEGRPSWRKMWRPVLVTWVAGLLTTVALASQSFVTSQVLTMGGPAHSTITLPLMVFQLGFRNMDAGAASAAAVLIMVVSMLLGLVTGLIVVLSHLRLEMVPWAKRSGWFSGDGKPVWRRVVAIVLCLLVLLVSLGACLESGFPWLLSAISSLKDSQAMLEVPLLSPSSSPSLDAYGRLADQVPMGTIWLNTLLPPIVAVFVQVLFAYIGALGIGAARPLKKWSELLLLPFSPWLFVTTVPLSVASYMVRIDAGLVNTLWGLIPPIVFSVPMLFAFTLFFKGQVPKAHAAQAEGRSWGGAFFKQLILPSLPLVLLLACLSLLFSMQDLLWQLVAAVKIESATANVAMFSLARAAAMRDWPLLMAGVVLFGLPPALFFFLVLGLLQALYLDRLALAGDRPDGDLEEPSMPDSGPAERARETVRLEEETERKTVRLEEEGAKVTRRLEPEEPKVTKRLEPESERKTVRLGEEDTGKTSRLEPEEPKVTRRLEPEEPKVTRRLEPEEDDTEA